MKKAIGIVLTCAALGGCAGKYERLAKCSAEENPVPTLAYTSERQSRSMASAAIVNIAGEDDCGPMRPVNPF